MNKKDIIILTHDKKHGRAYSVYMPYRLNLMLAKDLVKHNILDHKFQSLALLIEFLSEYSH